MEQVPSDRSDERPLYMDEAAYLLPGWPGYRTRPGRSGLDYLDSEFELAHMEGLFLRRLLTGKLRTANPIYLVAMALLGITCILPAVFTFYSPTLEAVCVGALVFLPMALGGTALLYNLALNLKSDR